MRDSGLFILGCVLGALAMLIFVTIGVWDENSRAYCRSVNGQYANWSQDCYINGELLNKRIEEK